MQHNDTDTEGLTVSSPRWIAPGVVPEVAVARGSVAMPCEYGLVCVSVARPLPDKLRLARPFGRAVV